MASTASVNGAPKLLFLPPPPAPPPCWPTQPRRAARAPTLSLVLAPLCAASVLFGVLAAAHILGAVQLYGGPDGGQAEGGGRRHAVVVPVFGGGLAAAAAKAAAALQAKVQAPEAAEVVQSVARMSWRTLEQQPSPAGEESLQVDVAGHQSGRQQTQAQQEPQENEPAKQQGDEAHVGNAPGVQRLLLQQAAQPRAGAARNAPRPVPGLGVRAGAVAGTTQLTPAAAGRAAVAVPPLRHFSYDIAMSTGYRPQFGATLATCLVGLLASGASRHAAALHLLLSDARLLNFSLLHNLAHMGSAVRLSLYDMEGASKSMRARNVFYQLLLAPDLPPAVDPGEATMLRARQRSLIVYDRPRPHAAAAAVAVAAATRREMQEAAAGAGSADNGSAGGAGAGAGSDALAGAAVGAAGAGGGGSDLPAVFLEDDVWLVDDFPRKLHAVASHAARRTKGGSFVLKLYLSTGGLGPPAAIRAQHAKACNATSTNFTALIAQRRRAASDGGATGAVLVTVGGGGGSSAGGSGAGGGYRAKPRTYKWGAQGLYFSDGATRRALAACYAQYTARSFERQRRYKDWPLKHCLAQLGVAVFDSGRALLQHIGAASSLFGAASDNRRYHRACSFPFVEKLPSEDRREDWF